jgi:hypothetical protein
MDQRREEDQAKADAVKAARVALKEAQKAERPVRPAK